MHVVGKFLILLGISAHCMGQYGQQRPRPGYGGGGGSGYGINKPIREPSNIFAPSSYGPVQGQGNYGPPNRGDSYRYGRASPQGEGWSAGGSSGPSGGYGGPAPVHQAQGTNNYGSTLPAPSHGGGGGGYGGGGPVKPQGPSGGGYGSNQGPVETPGFGGGYGSGSPGYTQAAPIKSPGHGGGYGSSGGAYSQASPIKSPGHGSGYGSSSGAYSQAGPIKSPGHGGGYGGNKPQAPLGGGFGGGSGYGGKPVPPQAFGGAPAGGSGWNAGGGKPVVPSGGYGNSNPAFGASYAQPVIQKPSGYTAQPNKPLEGSYSSPPVLDHPKPVGNPALSSGSYGGGFDGGADSYQPMKSSYGSSPAGGAGGYGSAPFGGSPVKGPTHSSYSAPSSPSGSYQNRPHRNPLSIKQPILENNFGGGYGGDNTPIPAGTDSYSNIPVTNGKPLDAESGYPNTDLLPPGPTASTFGWGSSSSSSQKLPPSHGPSYGSQPSPSNHNNKPLGGNSGHSGGPFGGGGGYGVSEPIKESSGIFAPSSYGNAGGNTHPAGSYPGAAASNSKPVVSSPAGYGSSGGGSGWGSGNSGGSQGGGGSGWGSGSSGGPEVFKNQDTENIALYKRSSIQW